MEDIITIVSEDTTYRSDMTYMQKYAYAERSAVIKHYYIFKPKEDGFYVGEHSIVIRQSGNRIYPSPVRGLNLTYKNGKFYGNLLSSEIAFNANSQFLLFVFGCLKIKWLKTFDASFTRFLVKPSIFKAILSGKIYSMQTLVQFIGRKCYGLKTFNWKILNKYIINNQGVSILDIRDFTSNVDLSLELLLNRNNAIGNFGEYDDKELLFRDLISYAKKYNVVINPSWSYNRMTNEHDKYVKQQNKELIESKSSECIYRNSFMEKINSDKITVISSERDLFKLGLRMSNCVYTYWSRVRNGVYIVINYKSREGDVCVGINCYSTVELQQMYLARNQRTSPDIREEVLKFIEDNKESLKTLAHSAVLKVKDDLSDDELLDAIIDMPACIF